MATKGMNAFECAKVLYGVNGEKIKEVMKSYPLFSKLVIMMNSHELLELLEAIPKVTARVIENGLTNGMEDADAEEVEVNTDTDDFEDVEEVEEEVEEKPKKRGRRKKVEEPEPEEDEDDEVVGGYDNMTAKRLYEEICKRGISTRLKKRDKLTMIKCLKDHDEELKKTEKEDVEEPSDEGAKYKGKTAKELYMMCKERGIKVEQKKNAAFYANELIKADKAEAEAEDDDWGDDGDGEDWDF